jgi:hypothetical protein
MFRLHRTGTVDPAAHEMLSGRKSVAAVPLTGLCCSRWPVCIVSRDEIVEFLNRGWFQHLDTPPCVRATRHVCQNRSRRARRDVHVPPSATSRPGHSFLSRSHAADPPASAPSIRLSHIRAPSQTRRLPASFSSRNARATGSRHEDRRGRRAAIDAGGDRVLDRGEFRAARGSRCPPPSATGSGLAGKPFRPGTVPAEPQRFPHHARQRHRWRLGSAAVSLLTPSPHMPCCVTVSMRMCWCLAKLPSACGCLLRIHMPCGSYGALVLFTRSLISSGLRARP